ncbi:LuxR family transcriptional regulator [Corynebacterium frankenforstense]|uniref:LuxR family transcriptional regulator n=1 Tax=Corynebacterium frankenforstense TaxID=1230998 RepID=UPI0026EBFE20|nr:LuxR family transcriptional regulator [Corynebacterium frankenforstense]
MPRPGVPEFTPGTFGAPAAGAVNDMTVYDVPALAPAPRSGNRPAVQRLLEGDGVNLIAMRFRPGQSMIRHSAAHPITVQCLTGHVRYGCECGCGQVVDLVPGVVVHMPAGLVHWIEAPADNEGESVFLLSMLTGERHSVPQDPDDAGAAGAEHAPDAPGAPDTTD